MSENKLLCCFSTIVRGKQTIFIFLLHFFFIYLKYNYLSGIFSRLLLFFLLKNTKKKIKKTIQLVNCLSFVNSCFLLCCCFLSYRNIFFYFYRHFSCVVYVKAAFKAKVMFYIFLGSVGLFF